MKIDLNLIDREQFMIHEHIWNGEKVYLVQPQHIGCKWTQKNKIFRSSVWNEAGELVSAGFPKFTNWGENPDNFPVPTSLEHAVATAKLDGSLLIVTKYKGNLMLRTRGTVDASLLNNGHELAAFPEVLKDFLPEHPEETWTFSLLFEWVSPINRIVINYGDKPDWTLVGIIDHMNDYRLFTQYELDTIASTYKFKRPTVYIFRSVEDMLQQVESWKGTEGVVVYSKDGQVLHKAKSLWYLALHKLKSEISSIEKLVDVWITWGMPTYAEFEAKLVAQFDYELFTQVRGDVSKICDAKKEVDNIVATMKVKVESYKTWPRKDAAVAIIASYGQTARKGIMFSLLDGKNLVADNWKTLVLQVIAQ